MNKRVLIADDEADITTLLEAGLSDTYQVTSVHSGEEAIAAFNREPFPLVLSDVRMPGMDGFHLAHELKGLAPCCEVILMSGNAEPDRVLDALNDEVFAFLRKPLRIGHVRRRLAQAALVVAGNESGRRFPGKS